MEDVTGRKYFPHSTLWIDPPDDAVYGQDEHEPPDDSDDFDSSNDTDDRVVYNSDQLTYHLTHAKNGYDPVAYAYRRMNSYSGYPPAELRTLDTINRFITESETPTALRLLVPGAVCVRNRSGFNSDRRGADSTSIRLDFSEEWLIEPDDESYITYDQLAEAVFRLKSHKFDFWYELYCGCQIKHQDGGSIDITLTYDHGS